jgi:hypothetical protein
MESYTGLAAKPAVPDVDLTSRSNQKCEKTVQTEHVHLPPR